MSTPYQIPFDIEGNLQNYPLPLYVGRGEVAFLDNFEFEDELQYVGYQGGRSSMSMIFQSTTTERIYPMFFTYFNKLIKSEDIRPGPTFKRKWTFIKKGQNYSIRPVE